MSEKNTASTIQKTCPKCGNIVSSGAVDCNECGYKFADKPMSPKAPRKTCPKCGNTVPIRVVACNACGYQFPFKDGTTAKTQKKPPASKNLGQATAVSASVQTQRDKNRPRRAIIASGVSLLVYNAILIFVMAMIYRSGTDAWTYAVVSTCSIVVSAVAGGVIGCACSDSYGKYSLGVFWGYLFIALGATALTDWLYFNRTLPAYLGAWRWGMGALAISASASIVICMICLYISLKDSYCGYCGVANVLTFSHDENQKEVYGYEFKTHKAHKETATGRISRSFVDSAEVEINYTVPEYQENLGLHKYTTKDRIYVCEKCGRTVKRKLSSKEKVDTL